MIPALLTGSRVYGRPAKKSDLDLVLLVTASQMELLKSVADEVVPTHYDAGDPLANSIRFGRLNVIAVTDPVAFAVFEKGTAFLKATRKKKGKGVSREEAVACMAGLRRRHNVGDQQPPRLSLSAGNDIPF